jgi:hypothetical protein
VAHKKKILFRKPWFRLILVGIVLTVININFAFEFTDINRDGAISALKSSILIFAICAALAIALYSNHIKGLRNESLKYISDVRDRLEFVYDKFSNSSDSNIQETIKL